MLSNRRSQGSALSMNPEGRSELRDLFSEPHVSCPLTAAPLCDCKPLWLLTGTYVCVYQRLS